MMYIFILYRTFVLIAAISGFFLLKKSKNIHVNSKTKLHNKYVLLFPAFNEQAIAKTTCVFYEKWLKTDNTLELIIIGDTHEKSVPTTIDIAREYFFTSPVKDKITFLVCDKKKGSKASKVNLAIKHLRKKYDKLPYVMVFDFDAKVQWKDFLKADQLVSKTDGEIFSFTPMIQSRKKESILMNSYLIQHFERVLVNELGYRMIPFYLRYPMGASMILTPSTWNYIRLIPEPIDDLPMGYLLAKKGAKCITLPLFTFVEATPNIENLYRQYVPIFTGVFSRVSTLKQFKVKLSLRDYGIEFLCNVYTIVEFLAIFYSLVLALLGNFIPVYFLLTQTMVNLIVLEKFSLKNVMFGLVGYYVRLSLFINFLFVKYLKEVDLSTYKTPRI